jgi:hypothetical protein
VKSWWWLWVAALAAGLAACKEDLSAPGHCPELCPGTQIPIFDTTIVATAGSDSSFFGYLSQAAHQGVLVSNGLPAAEARAFVVFPAIRTDSFPLDGALQKFTPDTAAFTFTLQARDSTATNLKIYLHRIPLTVDTTITYAALDAAISAGPILDSILVPDSVKSGAVQVFLTGPELALLTTPPADSGKIGVGLRVAASKPTGVRLALDPLSLTGSAPKFEYRGKVAVPDTTRQRQTASVTATNTTKTGYRFETVLAANPNPDLLYLGGPLAGRTIIRFAIPIMIKDTSQILKATLLLTPASPLYGLPNALHADSISARTVVVDLGAKSPPVSSSVSPIESGLATSGTTSPVEINVLPFVQQWKPKNGPPQVLVVFHNQENVGFMQPVFYSTRSAIGAPRLRIVYGLPTGTNTP